MTPADMTNEQLAKILDELAKAVFDSPEIAEAANRLRNSIPTPKVEVQVVDYEHDLAEVNVNDHNIIGGEYSRNAHLRAAQLRKALGIKEAP